MPRICGCHACEKQDKFSTFQKPKSGGLSDNIQKGIRTMAGKTIDNPKRIEGIHGFSDSLSHLAASYQTHPDALWKMNICPDCLKLRNKRPLSEQLGDFGMCGGCHSLRRVFDAMLLSVYKSMSFSPDEIDNHLPKLRQSFPHRKAIPLDLLMKRIEAVADLKADNFRQERE